MKLTVIIALLAIMLTTAYADDSVCGNDMNGQPITDGPFAVEEDCNMFYHCFEGVQFKASCGSGYSFNKVTMMCALSEEVQC